MAFIAHAAEKAGAGIIGAAVVLPGFGVIQLHGEIKPRVFRHIAVFERIAFVVLATVHQLALPGGIQTIQPDFTLSRAAQFAAFGGKRLPGMMAAIHGREGEAVFGAGAIVTFQKKALLLVGRISQPLAIGLFDVVAAPHRGVEQAVPAAAVVLQEDGGAGLPLLVVGVVADFQQSAHILPFAQNSCASRLSSFTAPPNPPLPRDTSNEPLSTVTWRSNSGSMNTEPCR